MARILKSMNAQRKHIPPPPPALHPAALLLACARMLRKPFARAAEHELQAAALLAGQQRQAVCVQLRPEAVGHQAAVPQHRGRRVGRGREVGCATGAGGRAGEKVG